MLSKRRSWRDAKAVLRTSSSFYNIFVSYTYFVKKLTTAVDAVPQFKNLKSY